MQNFLPFIALIIISVVFLVFSVVVFYHIGRYSFVGDSSKRFSAIFICIVAAIIFFSLVFMIINHLSA